VRDSLSQGERHGNFPLLIIDVPTNVAPSRRPVGRPLPKGVMQSDFSREASRVHNRDSCCCAPEASGLKPLSMTPYSY
jgi:hypothetical protein